LALFPDRIVQLRRRIRGIAFDPPAPGGFAAWISLQEFTDIVAISQMTPGPIALNAATFVGVRIAGIAGGIVATAGCITPSCIIVLILARYFFRYRDLHFMQSILRGLRPAVAAMIAAASISIVATALFVVVPAGFRLPRLSDLDIAAVGIFIVALSCSVDSRSNCCP
jgi:chromate transporter